MSPSNLSARQGVLLLQVGIALLLVTSLWGFVFPSLAAPRIGLSAHSLIALLAVLLLALGSAWTKVVLSPAALRVAFWLLLYSGLAIVAAYVLGAIWGA